MSTCRATQRRLSSAEARRATTLDWTEPVDLSTFARRILAPALAATRPPASAPGRVCRRRRGAAGLPDILECLAHLAGEVGGYRVAARLF